jgi:hypothetical protein
MILDCVLTAVNENPLYLNFIPIFIKTWEKLYPNIEIKIVLISEKIPDKFKEYEKHILLFKPIENISSAFISQYIRILYPCILNNKNGVLISDIDMMPLNRNYFTEMIKSQDNTKFVYYRDKVCFQYNQLAMCYNIAVPNVWKDIFNINSIDDINKRLIDVYKNIKYVDGHGQSGWCTDQIDLYKYVMDWNKKTNNLVCLKETKFNRLDRHTFNIEDLHLRKLISNGYFIDYHCFRPNEGEYEKINNFINNLL